ncbi:hypothetical protein EGW08_019926, partial [Elysia chlorotica]
QLFGLASLVVGIIFKLGWDEVRDAFVDNSDQVDVNLQQAGDTVAYGAIVFGCFIIVISLAGCIGACCQVKCLLVVVSPRVKVEKVKVAQIKVKVIRDNIAGALRDTLKNYNENSTDSTSKAFSAIFSSLECCAVEDYKTDFKTDTAGIPFYPASVRDVSKYPLVIPITCCRDVDYESNMDASFFDQHSECLKTPSEDNAYVQGCLDSIKDEIDSNKAVFIGVGVTILVIEVLVVIMAFVLCCRDDD